MTCVACNIKKCRDMAAFSGNRMVEMLDVSRKKTNVWVVPNHIDLQKVVRMQDDEEFREKSFIFSYKVGDAKKHTCKEESQNG